MQSNYPIIASLARTQKPTALGTSASKTLFYSESLPLCGLWSGRLPVQLANAIFAGLLFAFGLLHLLGRGRSFRLDYGRFRVDLCIHGGTPKRNLLLAIST
jgi:hypothetical protein